MCVCEQSNIGLRLMLHSSSVTAKLVVYVCVWTEQHWSEAHVAQFLSDS